MLVKTGLLLLVVWVVGLTGLYGLGDTFHIFLLIGLLLLLIAAARARDDVMRPPPADKRG